VAERDLRVETGRPSAVADSPLAVGLGAVKRRTRRLQFGCSCTSRGDLEASVLDLGNLEELDFDLDLQTVAWASASADWSWPVGLATSGIQGLPDWASWGSRSAREPLASRTS
jgi:hypothetical protein